MHATIWVVMIASGTMYGWGALYHHFAGKETLFEAVFEAIEADIAKAIISTTRGIADPVEALRTGCDAFLKMTREETVRRVVLIDAPAVLGWQKWREIDGRHGFGLLKASLKTAAAGRSPAELTDMFAHILLAALMETALVIARASNTAAATRNGRAAIRELIERLLSR